MPGWPGWPGGAPPGTKEPARAGGERRERGVRRHGGGDGKKNQQSGSRVFGSHLVFFGVVCYAGQRPCARRALAEAEQTAARRAAVAARKKRAALAMRAGVATQSHLPTG